MYTLVKVGLCRDQVLASALVKGTEGRINLLFVSNHKLQSKASVCLNVKIFLCFDN